MAAFKAFTHILETHIPFDEVGDQMRWKLRMNGEFGIWSFYCGLRASSFVIFPWKAIWGVKVPKRVSCFFGQWHGGKILTTDNLKRRRFYLADWCCMCSCDGELVDHLLLHCW